MAPFIYLGLALAGGLALLKRSDTGPAVAATTDAALIDPSEKSHPNAEIARRAIVAAMHFNSMALYENTAIAIEGLKMPKTAANVRTWAQMAKSGGQTVAGDDEIGGTRGYGEYDEVGARAVKKLYAKHTAARSKRRPQAKAKPTAKARRRSSSSAAPLAGAATVSLAAVDSSPDEPATPRDVLALASSPAAADAMASSWDDSDDSDGDDDDGDEVGATRSRRLPNRLPDWLRFSATQSLLAGDPNLIKATAKVMARMGYTEHAAIYLRELDR